MEYQQIEQTTIHGLRRFFARKIDYCIAFFIMQCLFDLYFIVIVSFDLYNINLPVLGPTLNGVILAVFVLAFLLSTIIIYTYLSCKYFSNTIGKMIFGIKILNSDNTELNLSQITLRELLLSYYSGYIFYLINISLSISTTIVMTLVDLFVRIFALFGAFYGIRLLFLCFKKFASNHTTIWDEEGKYKILFKNISWLHSILLSCIIIMSMLAIEVMGRENDPQQELNPPKTSTSSV